MGRVLGVDSGGTKTIAAIADRSGQVLDIAFADGLDPTAGGNWEGALAALVAPFGAFDTAVLGLPFHGEIPTVSARQIAVAQALIGSGAIVMNDVAVAFEGALGGQDGVLILAGTGSMAWARGPLGTVRPGGWGDAFGDEGSAYWIGRKALGMVSQHLDGRRASPDFAAAMLGRLGVTAEDLIGWAYAQSNLRAGMAGVAVHVSALAGAGLPDAQALMRRAAAHLALLAQTAARLCGAKSPLRWSYAGGVFADVGVRAAVTAQVGSAPIQPVLSPVGGAVLCAAKAAGWATDADFIDQLNQSLHNKMSENHTPTVEVTP